MSKGAYKVSDNYVGPSKDGSFRSCLCAMLIFFAICGSILLIAHLVKNSGSKKQESLGTADQQKGNKFHDPKNTENQALKPVVSSTNKPLKTHSTTKEPATPIHTTTNLNEADFGAEDVDDVTQDPGARSGKLQENIGTTVIAPNISDKSEEKPETEAPQTSTVSAKGNVLPTETGKGQTSTQSTTETTEQTSGKIASTTQSSDKKILGQPVDGGNTEPPNEQTTKLQENPATELTNKITKAESLDKGNESTTEPIDKSKIQQSKDKHTTEQTKDLTTEQTTDITTTEQTTDITTTEQSKNRNTKLPIDKSKIKQSEDRSTTEQTKDVTTTELPADGKTEQPVDKSKIIQIIKSTTEEITTEHSTNKPKLQQSTETTTPQDNVIREKPADEIKKQLNSETTTEKITVIKSPVDKLTTETVQSTQLTITKQPIDTTTQKINIATTQQPETSTTVLEGQQTTTPVFIESSTNKLTSRAVIHETAEVDDRKTTSNPDNHHHEQCDSVCMKSVARIFTRMNHLGDACEDFYDYACGGDYIDNTVEDHWRKIATEMEKINDNSQKAQKTFKNFYDKCVDFQMSYDYPERVIEALNLISLVNQSVEAQENDKAALTVLLTRLLQIDSSPLFDISVDVDKTSQRFVFQLNIGKRFLAIMNNYVTQKKCLYKSKKHFEFSIASFNHLDLNDLYKVYFNCQTNITYSNNVMEEALINLIHGDDVDEWPLDGMEKIAEHLKTYSPAKIRKDIVTKDFYYMKVAELNYNFRIIDWKLLLKTLVGKEVSEESLVQVYFLEYFKKMFKLLTNLKSERKVQDVILGMFIYDLYTNFLLPTSVENPEELCLKQSVDLMPEIASLLYLKSFTSDDVEEDQKRIENIFDTMKVKLEDMIQTSDWADISTQNALKKKINNMMLKTWNGSLIWENNTLLNERMKNVNENYDKYFDFKIMLNRRKQEMTFNMWNTLSYTNENIWWYFSKPYDTKPAIIYASDLVVIPPGMLFTKSNHLPRYLSLVKLGFSLGKAIGHHFDYIGSKYNISLQKSALASYKESEKCTEFYYTQEQTKMHYDGKSIQFKVKDEYIGLSTIERFVVQISLNLITSMLNEDKKDYEISFFLNSEFADIFEPEKLFFIALGQEHCTKPNLDDFFLALFESEHLPPALLLNKALINSEKFSNVFSCREGSGLNKPQLCPAFPELEKEDSVYEEDYN